MKKGGNTVFYDGSLSLLLSYVKGGIRTSNELLSPGSV